MSSDRIEALSRSLADSTSRRSLLKLLGVGVARTAVEAVPLFVLTYLSGTEHVGCTFTGGRCPLPSRPL
jgi:hypothetical protein